MDCFPVQNLNKTRTALEPSRADIEINHFEYDLTDSREMPNSNRYATKTLNKNDCLTDLDLGRRLCLYLSIS